MRLRETESCRNWLSQFPAEERIAAELLVDAVQITTTDQIKSDIEAAIQEVILSSNDLFYVAPIVSIEDVRQHLNLNRRGPELPRMFDDFQPLDVLGKDGGSENYLALVARDARSRFKEQASFGGAESDFRAAKNSECQLGFIFIVDNSMSGTQVSAFLDSFWRSTRVSGLLDKQRKRIQVHLICWGATRGVINKLESSPEYFKVNRTIVCEVPTVTTAFPAGESLNSVMQIIEKYPKLANPREIGKRGLGFGDTGALFLPLGSSAPNNMPDLLIRNAKKSGGYTALFPGRHIPPDVKALTPGPSPLPVRNVELFNERLRNQKLKTAVKISLGGHSKDWAMVLLMALHYSPTEIRSELGLSYQESKLILAKFVKIGWATEGFTLTAVGHSNLRKFGSRENYSEYRRGLRFALKGFDDDRRFYYPTSVRGVK